MKVLFSLPHDNLRSRARFLRYLDENVVMGRFRGEVRTGMMMHDDGQPAYCYIVDIEDYRKLIAGPFQWTQDTTAVVVIDGSYAVEVAPSLRGFSGSPSQRTATMRCLRYGPRPPQGSWFRLDDSDDYWKLTPDVPGGG